MYLVLSICKQMKDDKRMANLISKFDHKYICGASNQESIWESGKNFQKNFKRAV